MLGETNNKTLRNKPREKTCQMYICKEKKPMPLACCIAGNNSLLPNDLMISKEKKICLAFLYWHVLINANYCFQTRLFILDYWFSQITAKGVCMRIITFHAVLWHFLLILSQVVKKMYKNLKIIFYLCGIFLLHFETEILCSLS